MGKRALITGVQGFTGRYMALELHRAGYEVFGLAHVLDATPVPGVHATYACDLTDAAAVSKVLAEIKPDFVVHLAAIAFVAHGDIDAIYRTNVLGTRNLLQALVALETPLQAVLLASSANVYGNSTAGVLEESTSPAPANDYAVSKLAMEFMAKLYIGRLPLFFVRPFNYTGLGQSESFLLPKIISHVRRRAAVIELGNLDVDRDFSDVRVVVAYYRRLLEHPVMPGDTFNICSGIGHTLHDVLAQARLLAGYDFEVRVNPAFVRNNEVKTLIGSRLKLEQTVGVVPDIPLADTLEWMMS